MSSNAAGPFAGATSVASTCYKPVAAPAVSCTLAGLVNGTKCFVEVAAANAAGLSAYSAAASATPTAPPPPSAPARMAAPTVKAGKGTVSASWHPAVSSVPVSQYRVTSSTGVVECRTTALSCHFAAARGKKFRLDVAAMNVVGWSKSSALSAFVTVL